MSVVAAVIATVALATLAVLQILVALGRPYGRLVWGGQHRILPRRLRIGSAVSVVLYTAFAALLFWRSGVIGEPGVVAQVATWVLFVYFAAGIALNAISRSRLERIVMTPTVALLAACALVIALG